MFFRKLFKRKSAPIFWAPQPLSGDRRDIERAYARTFADDHGRVVLTHLQNMTFARAHAPDAPESQLRYAEGQRALVGTIIRLITAGRNPQ